jgi:hypothetical protein
LYCLIKLFGGTATATTTVAVVVPPRAFYSCSIRPLIREIRVKVVAVAVVVSDPIPKTRGKQLQFPPETPVPPMP